MDSIYVLRGRLEELYGRNSKVYDKVLQFILAMITFVVINNHVGFMKAAAMKFWLSAQRKNRG